MDPLLSHLIAWGVPLVVTLMLIGIDMSLSGLGRRVIAAHKRGMARLARLDRMPSTTSEESEVAA